MSSAIPYLTLGMLTGFLFLSSRSRDHSVESFRELRFPMRSQPRLSPLSGEQQIADPDGVLIDQGSQAIRVGKAAIQIYTNSQEVARFSSDGKVLIGETDSIIPVNSIGQQDKLTVKGGIVMTGSRVLESTPSSLTAYFYDQQLGQYYDYGGLKIMDRSYIQGSSVYLLGEWIQLQLSNPTVIKSFSLRVATSLPDISTSIPNIIHLLGSSDGLKWYLITSKLNQSTSFTSDFLTYPVTNVKSYRYYRVVFTQLTRNALSSSGPYLHIYGLQFIDENNSPLPPGPMGTNTQTVGGKTYTLSSSITTGNIVSFVDGDIQSINSSLVGLTKNQVGGSLNSNSYTVITFSSNNDYYLPNGSTWDSSGLSTTLALVGTTPFNSCVGFYSSYHGSYPVECMRIIHNGSSGMVGIGISEPNSNLSVLGSFETSYMSSNVFGTKVAINSTSANYLHFTSGISNALGFSQILFHSSDGLGTGTNNYYDTSIISYGGGEGQNNRGKLVLTADTVQVGTGLWSYQGYVGIGTSTPSQVFQIYTPSNYAGLTHTNGSCVLQTVLNGSTGIIGTTSNHSLGLMAGGNANLILTANGNVGLGTASPVQQLHLTGSQFIQNSSLFVGTDSLNNCLRLFQSSLGCYLDFTQNLFIRLNQSAGLAAPSYYTSLSINSTGYVGIGTTSANQATLGGAKCYGLDIYGSAGREVGLLRLVNVFTDSSVAKGSTIQFVTSHAAGKILQSQICGRSVNDAGSRGCIDFWVKSNSSGSDPADLLVTASVDQYGLISGSTAFSRAFQMTVANSVGQLEIGVAGAIGDYSASSSAGDSIIRTAQSSRNLMIQSGSGFPAIYVQSLDMSGNTRAQQSRVGIGSTTPEGIFTVYRRPQTLYSTDAFGDNSIDRYSLYVSSGVISNPGNWKNVSGPSVYLESGSIGTPSGEMAQSAKIVITGGQESGGSPVHGAIKFYTAMSIKPTVTIGTSGSIAGAMTYFGYNTTYLSTSSMNISSYALSADGNVITTGSFIATSDHRIKKNIVEADGTKALETLEKVKIYEYEMKDYLRDSGRKIGVIAQQVQKVLPEAVKTGEDDYVADLLAYVKVVYNDQVECLIQLFDPVELEEGNEIRLVNDVNEKVDVKVIKKVNSTLYQINETVDTERQWMVYGTLQKSILAVDKPMLGMLAISAIQQLSREVREMKEDIKKLWEVVKR